MDNVILELRNKTAFETESGGAEVKRGDWTTNLQEKIVVNEGDTILARNVFVDTKAITAPQTKISVPDNLKLEFQFMLYNMNWTGAVATTGGSAASQPTSSIKALNETINHVAKNDGKLYISCTKHDTTGVVVKQISEFTARAVYVFGRTGGNFHVGFFFKNRDGVDTQVIKLLPALNPGWGSTDYKQLIDITYRVGDPPTLPNGQLQSSDVAVYVCQGPSAQFKTIDFNKKMADLSEGLLKPQDGDFFENTAILKLPAGNTLADIQYAPKIHSVEIELEGGADVAYDPTELAQLINRKLTEIDPGTLTENELSGSNKFLQHIGKGAPGSNNDFNNFIEAIDSSRTDGGLYGFEYNTTSTGNQGSRWLGASQMELTFNTSTKKFAFDFMHTPVFVGGQTAVGIARAQQFPSTTDFSTYQVSRNGGVILFNLSAQNTRTGDYDPFWEETLGFGLYDPQTRKTSLNHLYGQFKMQTILTNGNTIAINDTPSSVAVFDPPIVAGVNATSGFQGLDSVVQKGDITSNNPFFQPPVLPTPQGDNTILATSDKSEQVEAPVGVLNAQTEVTFGYFLAEVQAQFGNRLINPDGAHNNRVAIVSRYYEENSYTSSSAGDAIVYQHKSPVPIYINSFKCRILDSDGNLSDIVGVDNTIFLEIVRANRNLSLEAPKKEPQEGMKEK